MEKTKEKIDFFKYVESYIPPIVEDDIKEKIAELYEYAELHIPPFVEEDMVKADYYEHGVEAYYKKRVRETLELIYPNNEVGKILFQVYGFDAGKYDNDVIGEMDAIGRLVSGLLKHYDSKQVWNETKEFIMLYLLLIKYKGYVRQGTESKQKKVNYKTLQEACEAPGSYANFIAQLKEKKLIDPNTKYWLGDNGKDLASILWNAHIFNFTQRKLNRFEIRDIMENDFRVNNSVANVNKSKKKKFTFDCFNK